MAGRLFAQERVGHTLQPTALVNEACLRIFGRAATIQDRRHLLALAAQAMRRLLVDHARARSAHKREGAKVHINVDHVAAYDPQSPDQLIFVDQIMHKLAQRDPRQARVIELRLFAGLSEKEIAEVLGVSDRTVRRDFKMAQAFLAGELRAANISVTRHQKFREQCAG